MSDNLGNNYYGYYPSPEEGASGNEYQPQNSSEVNGSLQVPHTVQPENGFQSSWYNPMYMSHMYPRTPSEEGIYNGHIPYMTSFSPPDAVVPPVVPPSGVGMTPMMTPQSPQTPSPSTLTNGNDHSPPTYYSPYRSLGAVGGTVEAPSGFQTEIDSTSHHNVSSESAHMAMQALSLSSSRNSAAESGLPHTERSSYDWQRRNFSSSDTHSGGITSDVASNENVEIKQEAAEAPWRPESNSPREEQDTRENNWKAGKTRTKDKYRVVYSDHQRVELEREFHYARYITIRRKTELASQLGLSERQVKIWFQNRRAKEKRVTKKEGGQPENSSEPQPHCSRYNPNEDYFYNSCYPYSRQRYGYSQSQMPAEYPYQTPPHTVSSPPQAAYQPLQAVSSPPQVPYSPQQVVSSPPQVPYSPQQAVSLPLQTVSSPPQASYSQLQAMSSPPQAAYSPLQAMSSPPQAAYSPLQPHISPQAHLYPQLRPHPHLYRPYSPPLFEPGSQNLRQRPLNSSLSPYLPANEISMPIQNISSELQQVKQEEDTEESKKTADQTTRSTSPSERSVCPKKGPFKYSKKSR